MLNCHVIVNNRTTIKFASWAKIGYVCLSSQTKKQICIQL